MKRGVRTGEEFGLGLCISHLLCANVLEYPACLCRGVIRQKNCRVGVDFAVRHVFKSCKV